MMTKLDALRDALATISGVATCKIGLEENITPDDYPLIRVVPSRFEPAETRMSGAVLTRKGEVTIYFGMPVQPFDEVADSGGYTALEKVYSALFTMEAAILGKLSTPPAGLIRSQYLETITDEDRLDTYKLMAIRCEIEG